MSVDEISPIRIALAVVTLLPIASPAVCTDQTWKPEWSWTYDGTIGPYRVRFELLEARGSVTGYYFYASQLKDIRLFGTIADGRRIELQGLATGGEPEAEISGEFLDKDPQGGLKGNLTCDIIIGTWHNTDGSSKLPVSLRTIASIPNPHGHGYEVAGASDDERINRAAERFRQAVTNGDQDMVTSMIRYPITVYLDHTRLKQSPHSFRVLHPGLAECLRQLLLLPPNHPVHSENVNCSESYSGWRAKT
ncbi:MAG: hypothetical protein JO210_06680 [Acidobacteriaceae bacterium]|nr:hypothetical protein [Acidobacteriaceae bacterium]